MAKTHKRVLSLILSLVMVLSLLPIQALAAVSISCTASDGAVITVTGDIPENAVVTAVPVPVELEGMKTLGAYDINITVDGAAWQPESPVEVSIESPAFEGYEELSVFHVDTDQALDYIDQYFGFLEQIMNFIKGLFSRKISSDEVSFMAEHFSIYAVGVPYVATYQFYDGPAGTDAQIIDSATQILKAGEAVQLPAAPAGDGIFQGWYIDGTTPLDGSYQVPELSADVTYNVYPKFDGVYYVYFLNENGQVVETIQTSAGETTEVSTEVASFVPTGNFKLVGWTLKKDGQDIVDSVSEADVTTDGAVYLYPVLQAAYWVHFDAQGGTAVESQSVQEGGEVDAPAEPTRTGYTFAGWYTAPTGGSQVSFPYQPTGTTTLYAHWNAGGTKYTVVYWLQDANDRTKYNYYSSEEKRGAAGQEVTMSEWDAKKATVENGDGQDVTIGTFARSETAVIKGDGTTVLNVYLDLVEFTFTFDLNNSRRTMTIGSVTYGGNATLICGTEEHTHRDDCYVLNCPYGGTDWDHWYHRDYCYKLVCKKEEHRHSSSCYESNVYAPKFVYGQDVSKLWPSRETAEFNFDFGGWNPDVSDSNWVTKRPVITSEMLPSEGTSVTLTALENDSERTVNYWFEALPDQTGEYTHTQNRVTYIWSEEYSQTYASSGNLSAKQIAGMEYVGNGRNVAEPYANYNFLYTRNRYTLSFNTQGGTDSVASETMMFEQSLSDKVPSAYVEGVTTKVVDGVTYTFTGWYTLPECYSNSKVDFATATMPASNLELYAGWDSQKETVYVYLTLEGDTAEKTWAITYGQSVQTYLDNSSLEMPEITVAPGEEFVGWCIKEADGSLTLYSLDAPVTGDLHLYPLVVSTAGYRVIYYAGAGSGEVPEDNQKYQYGSKASVLPGSGLTAPEGMVFSHWTYGGEEYLPNDQVEIPNHNITLTAVYVNEVDVPTVTVTYNANGGTGANITTEARPVNSKFVAMAYPQAWTAPTGYKFKAWNTATDGSGEAYAPHDEFRADTGSNVLYAQYEKDLSVTKTLSYTVEYYKDGEKADTETVTKSVWVGSDKVPVESGDINTTDKYVGYDFEKTDPETLPESVAANSVIKVYYVKDLTDVRDLSYTVEYHVDSAEGELLASESVTVKIWVNDSTYMVNSVPEKIFTGYKKAESGSTVLPAEVSDGGKIYVIYEKDLSVTKTLSYTVEYYKDGVLDEDATQTVEEKVWINSTQTTLTVDKNKINTTDKYEGFALDYTDPAEIPSTINDGRTIKVYYAKDVKGNENDPDEGDGIPDKYQVFVKYEANAGGSLTGDTYEAYNLRNADGTLNGSVTLTFPTPVAETNYVFDGWTNPDGVTVEGTTMSGFVVETTYTFTANFAKDDLVDPTEDEDPDKPGDGIADKYQVVVNYRAINGTVSFASTAVTKKDASGNPAENGTAKLTDDHIPTTTPNVGYILSNNPWAPATPMAGMEVKNGDTFTITYVLPHPYIPPVDPGTDIDDPDVPLADLPGLNTVDHYAYIAGYEDGTVRPNNNITRAEVATIFFRLFTDEYRETYWSTNNPFSDVAYTAWYNNAVSTTSNAGIIAGYPDGTFQPNNYITRAEFATIAARFLSEEYVGPDLFTDISGHWAAEYINRAANAGWINGYPDGSFRPNAYITRAEAMTLVNSMLGRMPHKDHMLENMVKWPDNPEAAWYYEAVQEATNGHDYDWYEEEDQLFYEIWTALQPNRDWAALEKEWSNAYSAPGGEVIG